MPVDIKAIARRFLDELWNQGDFNAVNRLLASDYDGHSSSEIHGTEGAIKFISKLRAAFPDFRFSILDQIEEGDKAATRWTINGTHTGEFQGMPPSGNRMELTGSTIFRIADGKLIEGWTNEDSLGMLEQIRTVPEKQQG